MFRLWLLLAVLLALLGCRGADPPAESIVLATTTSVRDSGLLDVLVDEFESRTGIGVKVVAVGSGQALELARRGDADLLITHAPDAEQRFMDEGHGARRLPLMHNEFIMVGPPDDPAAIGDAASIDEALARIVRSEAAFVSRGDDSGTHQREAKLWQDAQVTPPEERYIRAGAGMAEALRMASERQAYTLSDVGTFLSQQSRLELRVTYAADPALRNDYSVLTLAPERHPHVRHVAADRFADFLVSPDAQALIGDFGRGEFGQTLFTPAGE